MLQTLAGVLWGHGSKNCRRTSISLAGFAQAVPLARRSAIFSRNSNLRPSPAAPTAAEAQVITATTARGCPDPRIRWWDPRVLIPEGCPEFLQPPMPAEVPLTEGRDLLADTPWNTWSEARFTSVRDHRYGLDMETLLGSASLGVDRKITEDLAIGVTLGFESSRTRGFGRLLEVESKGFNIGPYIAYRLPPNWAIDASLSYGRSSNDLRLVSLDGDYAAQRFSGSINLHAQYDIEGFAVRPKVGVTYAHMRNDAYRLAGRIIGLSVDVGLPDDSFNFGLLETTTEIGRLFNLSDGTPLMPYVEVGARYEFVRPEGGEIMTGDLTLATPSPWSFTARGGLRTVIANRVQVDVAGGYLSFGQNNLDIWEGKVNISFGF
jgi:hypothetical protein